MNNKPYKHQPTRLEMKRALYHIEKLLGMIGSGKDTSAVVKLGTAKRFAAELTERMEMPA